MMTSETVSWDVHMIVRKAVQARFPERQHLRDQVLAELMISLMIAFPKIQTTLEFSEDGDGTQVNGLSAKPQRQDEQSKKLASDDGLWESIESILDLADTGLTGDPRAEKPIKRWFHSPPHLLDGKKVTEDGASLHALAACASRYLGAEWARSPTLELWLVRKMIFTETFDFSVTTGIPFHGRSYGYWWIILKSLVKVFIGVGVAVGIGEIHGLALGVLTFVGWLGLMRFLAQDQIRRLLKLSESFAAMRAAYVVSLREPPCPVEIEKHLSLAEECSAVWPEGLRSLVERGLSRNREYWV